MSKWTFSRTSARPIIENVLSTRFYRWDPSFLWSWQLLCQCPFWSTSLLHTHVCWMVGDLLEPCCEDKSFEGRCSMKVVLTVCWSVNMSLLKCCFQSDTKTSPPHPVFQWTCLGFPESKDASLSDVILPAALIPVHFGSGHRQVWDAVAVEPTVHISPEDIEK